MKRLAASVVTVIFALSSGLALATDTFVQSFSSQQTMQPGLVAALSEESSTSVEIAPGGDASRIYGVVIDPADAPATVSGDQQEDVFVATSGRYPLLVSVENGAISSGDYLSISSTDGIAAKAQPQQELVVGRALETFDGSSAVLTRNTAGDAVGKIVADIGVVQNPLINDDVSVPGPLRNIGESIAGKSVSPLRLYAALILLIATMLMAASLLWVGVRSGMVAIGRNPLSKRSVLNSLGQVLVVATLIFIIGVFGVYLLLKI